MSRLRRAAACVVLSVALLAGCGDDATPTDAVPALGERLEAVDTAVAAGDYAGARKAVQALVNETAQARVDGLLDGEDAEQIMRAAAALLERLPAATEAGTSQPAPSSPTATRTPEIGDLGELTKDDEKDEEKDEKDEEKDEKERDEKGERGNGRDDGDGN